MTTSEEVKAKFCKGHEPKAVILLNTGQEFGSVYKAAEAMGVNVGNLRTYLRLENGNRSCGKGPDGEKLRWKYK